MNYEYKIGDEGQEVVTLVPISKGDGLNFQFVLRKILAYAEDPQRPTFLSSERQQFINQILSHSDPLERFLMNVGQFEGLTNEVEEVAAREPGEDVRFLALEMRAEFLVREKESDAVPDYVEEMFLNIDGH